MPTSARGEAEYPRSVRVRGVTFEGATAWVCASDPHRLPHLWRRVGWLLRRGRQRQPTQGPLLQPTRSRIPIDAWWGVRGRTRLVS